MRHFVFRWFVTAFAVFVATPIVGLDYGGSLGCLLGASLLLGIINAFVRPVLLLLSFPLILVTLGLFILISGTDGRVHVLTHHTQIKQARGRVIGPDER